MCALCVMDQLLILTSLNVYGVRTSTQKLYRRDKCWEICCIVYLPSNIVFFCTHCVYKLPSALMAYDKTKEACSVVEDTITSNLKSLETTLTNKFNTLTDQFNELSTKMVQESNISMTTDALWLTLKLHPAKEIYQLNPLPPWLPRLCLKRRKSANST